MYIYVDLTNQFNEGRLRAILSSGQAVVLHRLAMMSKDGDWIVREDEDALVHILRVLNRNGARYRFGAPFDVRWLAGGWSSHFEFMNENLRIRTDFVSRPPRITPARLAGIWMEQEKRDFPFVDAADLAEIKKTNREKDYPIIGELARKMEHPEERLRYSRSARDILIAYRDDQTLVSRILQERGIDRDALANVEALETALDAERRRLMHANEHRLKLYALSAKNWSAIWNEVEMQIAGLSLLDAHTIIKEKASGILPFKPAEGNIHK